MLALLPKKRQNLLFSETFSADIRKLTQKPLVEPVKIEIAIENTAAETIEQIIYRVERVEKSALLMHLIKSIDWRQVLVFTSTKHGANRLTKN